MSTKMTYFGTIPYLHLVDILSSGIQRPRLGYLLILHGCVAWWDMLVRSIPPEYWYLDPMEHADLL